MVLGLKQLKLAAGILAGDAKAGGQAGFDAAMAIALKDIALKATDVGETLRNQDPVASALRDVSAKLEEATRKALSAEFGADWESKPDLAATLAALPDALECYAPAADEIFAENLGPERIARRATDAAEIAHDDLFRRNTVGERLLFVVVRQTYTVALANKDFALQMIRRGAARRALEQACGPAQTTLIYLHGIRTDASWRDPLSDIAVENGWKFPREGWNFGYFSLLRFLVSWQREAKVRWFRENYELLRRDRRFGFEDPNYPSIVAHSFGTYILGYSLIKYENIRFDKIILCGSILPRQFPWDEIIDRGQVLAIRNEYGVRDLWSGVVDYFVPGTGPSGKFGFCSKHNRIEEDKFVFDHSEYFSTGHMREFWVPFIKRPLEPLKRHHKSIDLPVTRKPWGLYLLGITILMLIGLSADFTPLLLYQVPCEFDYPSGSFIKEGDEGWVEYRPAPQPTSRFRENVTDSRYVYLADLDRHKPDDTNNSMLVRLPLTGGVAQWTWQNPLQWTGFTTVKPGKPCR